MPRPSKSILISPRSARSSLSHCTIVRSRIVAHSTGATRTSGSRVSTMPPEWMPMWRGKPSSRRHSVSSKPPVAPPAGVRAACPAACARSSTFPKPGLTSRSRRRWTDKGSSEPVAAASDSCASYSPATAATCAGEKPRARPTSRIAERVRYVITSAVIAACSRP